MHIYASAIRILAKGYLPNTLVTPFKLKEILSEVRKTLQVTNPDYYLVIDRLHLYYDTHLVTFDIDKDRNLIVQFPVFVQPYTQQPLILYQLETVPIPILDQNDRTYSHTHLKVEKPYIAINSDTYISLWQQELRTCKRTGYEFYCKGLFVVNTTLNMAVKELFISIWGPILLNKIAILNFTISKQTSLQLY